MINYFEVTKKLILNRYLPNKSIEYSLSDCGLTIIPFENISHLILSDEGNYISIVLKHSNVVYISQNMIYLEHYKNWIVSNNPT